MGYGDNRYGGDDNRNRGGGDRWRSEHGAEGRSGGGQGRDWGRGEDDRGFMERAGERVRSWLGDDDDDRQGRHHEPGRDRSDEHRMGGRESFGAGFGNQRGWRDERWDRDFGPAEGYESSGPRGDRERSDRGGQGWRDQNIGGGPGGYDATMRGASRRGRSDGDRTAGYEGGFGGGQPGLHDPHYAEWRQRQIEELDRDYEEYRRENHSRFEQEFGGWRQKRQSQRQLLGRITEHMEVVGSDGQHIGAVDKVLDDRIILTRTDPAAGGVHHSIPCSWVETVEGKVTVGKTAEEAMAQWRDEDSNRALFERHDQGRGGPHVLNRSFSGTYDDDKKG
jgi:hypothetical protein